MQDYLTMRRCCSCHTDMKVSSLQRGKIICDPCRDRNKRKAKETAVARGIADRDKNVARLHGLTVDGLLALRQSHNNLCAICGNPETKTKKNGHLYPLSVDHDHATGQVRGMLCQNCNWFVGHLEKVSRENVAQAYAYLDAHK